MSYSWSHTDGVAQRLFFAALAALLAFTVLVVIPGSVPAANAATNHTFEYVLVFQNGETVRSLPGGTTDGTGNTAWVPNVGGTDPDNPDDGMFIHMSCSDNFNLDLDPGDASYGYSTQGGGEPANPADSGWRIADYAFRRIGTNGGQCGNSGLFELGRIAVEKQTNPDGDPTAFEFTGDAQGTLSDGQQIVIENVEPGTYTSTEVVPAGWDLTSIDCDSGGSGDVTAKTATFTIVAGETITCVFTNTKQPPPPEPSIQIEKATNGQDADEAPGPTQIVGSPVTWTYVVTNNGAVDLIAVTVTDDKLGDICTIPELDAGASFECEKEGTATTVGQYANIGSVVGYYGDELRVTDADPSHYFGQAPVSEEFPSIDIEKATNGDDADTAPGPSVTVGEPVTWTYVVTNNGSVDVFGIAVTDDLLGDVCTIDSLAVGASDTCDLTGVAVAGQYENIGTATVGDTTISDSDPSHYFGQEIAASATIGDFVWNDEDGDGVQDAGEKGIAGAKVKLTLPDGTTAEAVTNASGLYLFSALEAGTYKAELVLSSIPEPAEGSNTVTTPSTFTIELAQDETYLDADFGIVAALPKTGLSTDALALIALALLVAGTFAILATREQARDINTEDTVT